MLNALDLGWGGAGVGHLQGEVGPGTEAGMSLWRILAVAGGRQEGPAGAGCVEQPGIRLGRSPGRPQLASVWTQGGRWVAKLWLSPGQAPVPAFAQGPKPGQERASGCRAVTEDYSVGAQGQESDSCRKPSLLVLGYSANRPRSPRPRSPEGARKTMGDRRSETRNQVEKCPERIRGALLLHPFAPLPPELPEVEPGLARARSQAAPRPRGTAQEASAPAQTEGPAPSAVP